MNPLLIKARTVARKTGLIKLLKAVMPTRNYEERFHSALMEGIKAGDTIWDVGANIGFYTEKFAEIVGEHGSVVAFEPAPDAASKVAAIAGRYPVIQLVQAAVSEKSGTSYFDVSSGGDSVTNHLSGEAGKDRENSVAVDVVSGDSYAKENGVPDVIKIDVEGFEIEAIRGMENILKNKKLRAVYCEVHFGVLESRGMASAPIEIERRLSQAGFSIKWVDASHIAATKG